MNIDYNRGVLKRAHPSGIEIYMYLDTPGVYLNARGDEVNEVLAAGAGYPVEEFGKEKLKRARMSQAMRTIEDEIGASAGVEKVEDDHNGYELVNIGLGRYHVRDPDGNNLTPVSVSKEIAEVLLRNMGVKDADPKEEPDEENPPKVPLKGGAAKQE